MKLQSTSELLLTYEGKVATITLNRPQVLNAVNEQLLVDLASTLETANLDESSALVITGAGRAFCAGGDHQTLRESIDGAVADSDVNRIDYAVAQMVNAFVNLEKPILAAVNGIAIGLGATIALHCDYIVLSEDARIGDRHVLIGLVPGADAAIWTMLLGPLRAKEFLMSGRLLSALEAEAVGLANKVVPADRLMATVMEQANLLADLPAFAVRKTKLAINRYMRMVTDEIFPVAYAWEQLSSKTADHENALREFNKGVSKELKD